MRRMRNPQDRRRAIDGTLYEVAMSESREHGSTMGAEAAATDGTAAAYMRAARAGSLHPRARADVTATDIDDEIILYNPLDGATHALNVTAALVWDLCDGTRTLDELAAEVAATFDIPIDSARADVEPLIAQLCRLQLLDTTPAS